MLLDTLGEYQEQRTEDALEEREWLNNTAFNRTQSKKGTVYTFELVVFCQSLGAPLDNARMIRFRIFGITWVLYCFRRTGCPAAPSLKT